MDQEQKRLTTLQEQIENRILELQNTNADGRYRYDELIEARINELTEIKKTINHLIKKRG